MIETTGTESVYELDNIGLEEHNLIVNEEQIYIENAYSLFDLKNLDNMKIEDDFIFIINEDQEILKLTSEQFLIIKEIIE